jgi:hypothetical protein
MTEAKELAGNVPEPVSNMSGCVHHSYVPAEGSSCEISIHSLYFLIILYTSVLNVV